MKYAMSVAEVDEVTCAPNVTTGSLVSAATTKPPSPSSNADTSLGQVGSLLNGPS